MAEIEIENLPLSVLRPYARNARTHSPKQIAQIAASIREFGFNNPVLIDRDGEIIAGHGRVAAAKKIGLETVPCVRLEHLSEAQKRAYILADNRLAEKAGWDREILAIELQHLTEIDVDFDVTVTGFEMAEVDLLLGAGDKPDAKSDPADTVPTVADGPAVTRSGDVWQIGRHRLICGDALAPETYTQLLAGEQAEMIFTDPPYNVKIDGHVSGLGAAKHREFAFASGEMTEDEFTRFLARVFVNLANAAADGAIHFVCMDWRHQGEVLAAARGTYSELKNLCVWAKTNGGMGSLYRSQHELVFVFKSGRAPHINNVELGKHGRYRTNVWSYAGANAFSATRDDDLAMHPTVKPVALVADAILDCSKRKGLVLDAFGGSGTTLVAAERTGRRGAAIEIDPHYCDVIVRRLAKACNLAATLVATGLSFDEVAKLRRSEAQAEEAA
ncbi:MAG: ParB N-terminal domain-containing protein [Hyphomicrobiaceae bacterium]|nr:ParB N-terminal domain-containing protein [Hyphomicrobiaceae bacterium]MCC0009097.1 ParB N-terminal domain-containing protein [Hyphomicrobiaceae bacterium]